RRRSWAKAVAFGPAIDHAHRGPAERVDHDADARAVVDLDPDRHPEARVPAHVARRAVERVEHPPHAGRAGAARPRPAEDLAVAPRVADPLHDGVLGGPVDLGDEVARGGLPVDREPRAEPVQLDLRRSVREPHRERAELVEQLGGPGRAQGSMTLPNRTSRAGTRAMVSSLRRPMYVAAS